MARPGVVGMAVADKGVIMTLADWARQRRRNWKEEGRKEALPEIREEFLREKIAKVLADDTLTPEQKNRFIAVLIAR